jgi:hypothetical protein
MNMGWLILSCTRFFLFLPDELYFFTVAFAILTFSSFLLGLSRVFLHWSTTAIGLSYWYEFTLVVQLGAYFVQISMF